VEEIQASVVSMLNDILGGPDKIEVKIGYQ
jgi:hypothetical protein